MASAPCSRPGMLVGSSPFFLGPDVRASYLNLPGSSHRGLFSRPRFITRVNRVPYSLSSPRGLSQYPRHLPYNLGSLPALPMIELAIVTSPVTPGRSRAESKPCRLPEPTRIFLYTVWPLFKTVRCAFWLSLPGEHCPAWVRLLDTVTCSIR